jgi:hypothetical protein
MTNGSGIEGMNDHYHGPVSELHASIIVESRKQIPQHASTQNTSRKFFQQDKPLETPMPQWDAV